MKVLTESYLRRWCLKGRRGRPFALHRGMLLTPAARQYLQEQQIELEYQDDVAETVNEVEPDTRGYVSLDGRERYVSKPEHMTQLRGNVLVSKDHDRILFRGRIDFLQAEILLLFGKVKAHSAELAEDLRELLDWARSILQAEVMGVPLMSREILSLTDAELRAHSHNPRKYFGIGHILPEPETEPILLELNHLRTTVRQVELVAVKAFSNTDHPAGEDIIQALNRMSSAVYVLMLRCSVEKLSKGK